MRKVLLGAAAMIVAAGLSAPAGAQEKLTVWWVKGFYKSEDDALYADQEVRGQDQDQGRPVAICRAGHDPEDGGRA